MNYQYEPEPRDANPRFLSEEEAALLALQEIYLEAGLSEENAARSAAADLQQHYGIFTSCAA